MSKSLPVYDLGQWIRNKGAIGRVVARSVGEGFGILPEFDSNAQVHGMSDRGTGYCVEWIKLEFGLSIDGAMPPIIGFTPLRLRWIGSKTMADPRYQPCENPVKVPAVPEKPAIATGDVMWAAGSSGLEATFGTEPSQPVLPLDIEAATEATMRAAVALGNQASDWLRAKGLTP